MSESCNSSEELSTQCQYHDVFRRASLGSRSPPSRLAASQPHVPARPRPSSDPVKVLIITGDHGHAWKDTTERLGDILVNGGKIKVDVTTAPFLERSD